MSEGRGGESERERRSVRGRAGRKGGNRGRFCSPLTTTQRKQNRLEREQASKPLPFSLLSLLFSALPSSFVRGRGIERTGRTNGTNGTNEHPPSRVKEGKQREDKQEERVFRRPCLPLVGSASSRPNRGGQELDSMLQLLAIAATPGNGYAVWAGGTGDWSDSLMWTGAQPDSSGVHEVQLCAWQSSRIIIGSSGGTSQPELVLCQGMTLEVAGRIFIAPVMEGPSPSPPPSPPSVLPPVQPSAANTWNNIWDALPVSVWIAIGGGALGVLSLAVIAIIATIRMCWRRRSRQSTPEPGLVVHQVHPGPTTSIESTDGDGDDWSHSQPPSFRSSQKWSGFV